LTNVRLSEADADYNDAKAEWKQASSPADKEFLEQGNGRRKEPPRATLGKVKRMLTTKRFQKAHAGILEEINALPDGPDKEDGVDEDGQARDRQALGAVGIAGKGRAIPCAARVEAELAAVLLAHHLATAAIPNKAVALVYVF